MSVTITIANNGRYSRENGLVTVDEYECQCIYEGVAHPACRECKATGKVRFERRPFEMNVANSNFFTLWTALGFAPDPDGLCGDMDARKLGAAIRGVKLKNIQRKARIETGGKGATLIDCGVGREQAAHYVERLLEIVEEGERREERIVWC